MDDLSVRLLVLAGVVLAATAAGLVMRARAGQARDVVSGDRLRAAELGAPLGREATFVQFSSPTCTSCRGVRRVLGELVDEELAGGRAVTHVELDATERLDLARRFGIMRTPTVLVLDPAGAVVRRVSGALTPAQARAALPSPDPHRS